MDRVSIGVRQTDLEVISDHFINSQKLVFTNLQISAFNNFALANVWLTCKPSLVLLRSCNISIGSKPLLVLVAISVRHNNNEAIFWRAIFSKVRF